VLYVALGDSTGVGVGAPQGGGYPERLARLLPALRLQNLCQGGATSAFSPDGFHPSAAGYQAWAERMLPLVKPLLREEAHP